MKIIRVLFIVISFLTQETIAQKVSVMATYGQSTFMYSPGIEANYFFHEKIGVQLGVSAYFLAYKPNQLVNISNHEKFNFHNLNIGVCGILLNYEKIKISYTIGGKMYYGPVFEPLHFFESAGYYIYYDASRSKADYGVDMGLFCYLNRYIVGIKFDTARHNIYYLIGWSF